MGLDVSKFQLQGEWLKLKVKSDINEKRELNLKIKPMKADEQFDMTEVTTENLKEKLKAKISELIVGWDLMDGDKDLPCDQRTKDKYLPYLTNLQVITEIDEKLDKDPMTKKDRPKLNTVALAVLAFAQNFDNFIKN